MAQRTIDTRIQWKRDTSANWTAKNPVLLNGEIIIVDTGSGETRFKIGDGTKTYTQLPFEDEAIRSLINGKTDNRIYIGDTEPTDPNVKIWINTAEEGTGVTPLLPRIATVTLSASGWAGSASPYSQVVSVNSVTANSKIDLQPTAQQIVSLQNDDIALMAENNSGTVTFYSIGGKPTYNYTMQVLLTEVAYV